MKIISMFPIFCLLLIASVQNVYANEYHPTTHHTVKVDGLDIFYREAGDRNNQTILLLHGFPTSSHMYRNLIPLLADEYHVIAPDYPGFGYSSTPSVNEFKYTFDNLANVIEKFTEIVKLDNYILFIHDYGGPVGLRLATRHPEKVKGLVVQNANAYKEGVTPLFQEMVLNLWGEATPKEQKAVRTLFELPITKKQYLDGAEYPKRVSPDAWTHAQWGMDRPGNKDIQYDLQANYGSNVELYDEWHAYFHEHQPKTLVVWGKNDFIFSVEGAHAYKKDLENIEVHILNAGHFLLEEKAVETAEHIKHFF